MLLKKKKKAIISFFLHTTIIFFFVDFVMTWVSFLVLKRLNCIFCVMVVVSGKNLWVLYECGVEDDEEKERRRWLKKKERRRWIYGKKMIKSEKN